MPFRIHLARARMRCLGIVVLALLLPVLAGAARPPAEVAWDLVAAPTTTSIRALDVVGRNIVWAASDGGEVVRSVDGGQSWDSVAPPDANGLLFRDVEAISADRAVLLAIGVGDASRIFLTENGGATWVETFRNPEPDGFYNCLDVWNARHGIVSGDPIDGVFRILVTDDGGRTWTRVPDDALPPADGEFGFSASGTCVETPGGTDAWFGTGGADARIFRTNDRGGSWTAVDTPLQATDAGGVFTIAMRTPRRGVALGGDFLAPDAATDAAATTIDGGRSWVPVDPEATISGYRSGADWVRGAWSSPSAPTARTSAPTAESTGPGSPTLASTSSPAAGPAPVGRPAPAVASPAWSSPADRQVVTR